LIILSRKIYILSIIITENNEFNIGKEMKVITVFLAFILSVIVVLYVLVFTTFGNGTLQPFIEKKIQEQTFSSTKLKIFSLNLTHLKIFIELNKNNILEIEGNYSLLEQSFDIKYNVKLEEIDRLQKLTQTQFQGSFRTDGTVVGNLEFIKVNGKSDVAKGATSYSVELTELNPTSIIATMKDIDLKSLLYILNQKSYASADINMDINFKNITPHKLDGNILLITKNGSLNSKVLKKDFDITIPKNTAFNMNLNAILNNDDVDYVYRLNSNLAKISSGGKVIPEPLSLDIKYGVNIKELALLKVITGADVRGALKLNGTVKGSKEKLLVEGKTDFASSKTKFRATLKDFQATNIQATVRGLKLQKALYMLKQPHYSDGYFDLDVDMSSVDVKNLKGIVKSRIYKGVLDSNYLSKTYEFKTAMPKVYFNATTYSLLAKETISTKVDFNSNIADLDMKNMRYKLSDNSLQSDYKVKMHNLDKFYFISERHLKGSLSANGEIKKAKDLDFTAHSKVAGGTVDVKLHNDDFHADMDSLQTLTLLDMLIYPKVFQSSLAGTVDYNLKREKGSMKASLKDGRFTKNQVLDLVRKYGKLNMYKEDFKGNVNADIDREYILASLDLKSNRSSILTKNTKLNSKTKKINSKIDISANGNPIVVTLTGDVNSPNVNIDAQKLIEKEATKAVTKEISKYLKRFF